MKQVLLGLTFACAAQAVKLQSDENDDIWWSEVIGYGVYGDYIAPQGIIERTAYPVEYFERDTVIHLGLKGTGLF